MRLQNLGIVLLISALVTACTALRPTPTVPVPTAISPTPSGSVGGVPGGVAACYYVWTSQQLPGLSKILQDALRGVVAGASGSANAYGEDCVSADGTRTFTPMETDFWVSLPATDLKDDQELGDLMAAAMKVIDQLPKDQLVGPRPGRVQFQFYSGTADSPAYLVDIDRFHREAAGLSGARLFHLFQSQP